MRLKDEKYILASVLFNIKAYQKHAVLTKDEVHTKTFYNIDTQKPFEVKYLYGKREYKIDETIFDKLGDKYILLNNIVEIIPIRDLVENWRGEDRLDFSTMIMEEHDMEYGYFHNNYKKIWNDVSKDFENFFRTSRGEGNYLDYEYTQEYIFILNEISYEYEPQYSYEGILDMKEVIDRLYRQGITQRLDEEEKKQHKQESDFWDKMMMEEIAGED